MCSQLFRRCWPLAWVPTSLHAQPTVTPAVTGWSLNTTSAKGTSSNAAVNAVLSQIDADIQQIRHNDTDVYINATGVPSLFNRALGSTPLSRRTVTS